MMVALALIGVGANPGEAIHLIRKERPGALNMKQASYVLGYKQPRGAKGCCLIY